MRLAKDVLKKDVADEAILINGKTGVYFALNATAADILRRLLDEKKSAEVANEMAAMYQIKVEQAEADIIDLIRDLKDNCLVV